MTTRDYLNLFFTFDKLAMTMTGRPTAVNMSFQREYAERYDWLKQQFTDWAFNATACVLYYNDYDSPDYDAKRFIQQSMAAFGGNAPAYHMACWVFRCCLTLC